MGYLKLYSVEAVILGLKQMLRYSLVLVCNLGIHVEIYNF